MSEKIEEIVEEAIKNILDRELKIRTLQREVDEFKEALDILAGQPDKTTGAISLDGLTFKAKLERKENVKYSDKDKLALLIKEHQEVLAPLFRVEIKESGQKVGTFLASTESEAPLVQEIKSIRVVTKGKTSLEVLPLKGK